LLAGDIRSHLAVGFQGLTHFPIIEHAHVAMAGKNVSPPTLQAYERALSRSPEDLELLLNAQALGTFSTDPVSVPIGAFAGSDAALHALFGDN